MAANNQVVGVLKTMLTMDTASFEAGAKKSDTTLKLVENSTKRLGTEVAKLTPQAERMVKAFSGDKLLYSANNLVTAITKIGGATKLTEQEQAKANRTLTAAIDKYVALGQTAPKAMTDLQRATAGASDQTKRFGLSVDQARGMLGAFGITLGVGTVVAFGRELLNTADQLVKVADRTGLTTTEVQKLQYIAGQSGNSLDELTGAVSRLQNNLISGDKSAVNAVKVLGINLESLKSQSPFEQLQSIAIEIAKIPDPAARAAIAIDIFGRTGAAILPTLISDFAKLGDAAPVMADKTVRALDEAGDAIGKFQMQLKVWAAESYNFLGRLFDQFVNFIRRGTASLLDGIAGVMELQAKIPGVAALWGALGINIESVRKQAQWFRDAADASTAALNRTDTEVRKNSGSLIDYEALLNKSAGTTKRAATEADKLAESYGRLNSEMANLQGQAFFDHDAELLRQNRVSGNPLEGLSPVNDQIFLPSQRVAGTDAITMAPDLGRRRQEQAKQISEFWQRQFGSLEQASIGRLGTLAFGNFGHDATGELKATADEAELDFLRIQRSGKATADELKTAFTRWQEASDRANYDFGERFKDVMGGVKQTFVGVLDDMLQYWTRNFIGGLIKGSSGANIAQGIGSLATGGATGAALGGGASFAASSVAGVEAAALGGGAGAGGSLAALATNPWTIGAAGAIAFGLLIAKKGLFRGGEEALHISPRRDKFFAQLQAMFGGTQFEAAVKASQKAKIAGNVAERLIGAVYRADDKQSYDPAQAAFMGALSAGGLKGVKGFSMGGFVPPGVVQPAILHGGQFGEDIIPRKGALGGGSPTIHQHYSVSIHAQALDADGMDKVFAEKILPRFHWEMRLNQRGTVTEMEKALGR